MPYVLGIDIGGTTTTAAVCRLGDTAWGAPEVVRLGSRSHSAPSVLHMAADGTLAVGDPARLDPTRVARGFIRRIGDEVPLLVAGEPCAAEALTAALATWVADRVAAQEGEPAEQVVIGHPAVWGPHRRGVLHRALGEVGLPKVTLLPEPVLAAESHTANGGAGSTLAVYSLGANDCEAAVVRWADPVGFRLLGRAGLVDPFGGADLDEALTGIVEAKLGRELRELRRSGDRGRLALLSLRRECARATDRLATAAETEVPAPLPYGQVLVRVTRAELAERVRPALQATVDMLAGTVQSSGLRPQQLDAVLLVGGAVRLPLVAELVGAALPTRVVAEPEPWATPARGAAVAAARLASPAPVPDPEPALPPAPAVAEIPIDPGPPPRPPVTIPPLKLPRPRRFGLVGSRP